MYLRQLGVPSPTVSKTPKYFCFKLWHHNQYIFTFGILFHHHQTVSDRWTTHRRGGGIIAMAWVVLVETVIDMWVPILFTNLLALNVMTLMAKYHKKKANWLWKTIQIWTIHPHSYGYKIILTHNSNPAYLRDVQTKWHTPVLSNMLSRDWSMARLCPRLLRIRE